MLLLVFAIKIRLRMHIITLYARHSHEKSQPSVLTQTKDNVMLYRAETNVL